MKNWIGLSIILIGIIHTLVGFVLGWSTFMILLNDGLFNTVNGQPMREFFFWFVMFGILSVLLGVFVRWVEKEIGYFPNWFGWSLLAFTILVVFIMPLSGGWLFLLPSIGIISKRSKQVI